MPGRSSGLIEPCAFTRVYSIRQVRYGETPLAVDLLGQPSPLLIVVYSLQHQEIREISVSLTLIYKKYTVTLMSHPFIP